MLPGRRIRSDERGETLIEILLTVMIMGVAFTGLLAALTYAVRGSDTQRRLADAEVIARSFGEAVKNTALNAPSTKLATAIADHDTSSTVVFTVSSAAGFPAAPFWVQVDTEVLRITSTVGTVFTSASSTSDKGYGSHATDTPVTLYDPCPSTTSALIVPSGFTTGSTKFNTPVITGVEYFAKDGSSVTSANCASYYKSSSSFCNNALDNAHFTLCDVPTFRVRFTVSSVDSTNASGATTSSAVTFRRGNA